MREPKTWKSTFNANKSKFPSEQALNYEILYQEVVQNENK